MSTSVGTRQGEACSDRLPPRATNAVAKGLVEVWHCADGGFCAGQASTIVPHQTENDDHPRVILERAEHS